jgi:hypothetical protein
MLQAQHSATLPAQQQQQQTRSMQMSLDGLAWHRPKPQLLQPPASEWKWLPAGACMGLLLDSTMSIQDSHAQVGRHPVHGKQGTCHGTPAARHCRHGLRGHEAFFGGDTAPNYMQRHMQQLITQLCRRPSPLSSAPPLHILTCFKVQRSRHSAQRVCVPAGGC